MKHTCAVGLVVLIAACSSHPVKCHGPLRPINTPAAGATATPGLPGASKSTPRPKPARGSKPTRGSKHTETDSQP
jgi:hypothetical protein